MAPHPEPMSKLHAIIVGAGIGGLTAALCLNQHGWDVTVLERAPALTEVGAGIQLSPNAMTVFRALGLEQALIDVGFLPEAIELRMGESGKRLLKAPLGTNSEKRWGGRYLHIHRADLIRILENTLNDRAPDSLQTGDAVISYAEDNDQVTATLASSKEIRGDILVGADGIHSVIHRQMLGDDAPRFTGNVAWRLTVPTDTLGKHAPPPTACAWMGKGRHAVTYRLRGGTVSNLVAVVERGDWQQESWFDEAPNAIALADFKDWHPTITTMLSQANKLYRWALYDRAPLSNWVDGRVCLLGDAAHPMLPFVAQGAAMAIEDAWALASLVPQNKDLVTALSNYQSLRLPRTSKVQKEARNNAKLFHKQTLPEQIAAYGPMWLAGRVGPELAFLKQDRFYSYDIVKEVS